jgi:hypothetical protein
MIGRAQGQLKTAIGPGARSVRPAVMLLRSSGAFLNGTWGRIAPMRRTTVALGFACAAFILLALDSFADYDMRLTNAGMCV